MNRQIRRVAGAVGVLMLALLINLNFVQVVKSDSYRDNPGNRRVILTEYSTPRGQIVVNGVPIAQSTATSDELKYLRTYSNGPLYAPVTGYYSLIYGKSGIEDAEDGVLQGTDNRLFGSRLSDILTGRDPKGGSVRLTINAAAQQAAYTAMNKQKGAVVALDPTTGAILAAVSLPSYDPNQLSSHDTAAITAYWNSLNPTDPESALQNRDFNETFPPGSVFKVILSAAALKLGVKPTDQIPAPNSYWPLGGSGPCPKSGGACVENFDGETCQNGTTATLAYALAKSCNTAFSELAVTKVGGAALAAEAKLFGLDGAALKIPMTVAGSTIGSQADLTDKAALAQTAFGQRDVRITPLQGAMIAAAVANNGTLNQPFVVDQELAPDLSVLSNDGPSTSDPKQLGTILDPTEDAELAQMMVGVVQDPEGTGGSAKITDIPNITVGGKTGTADTGFYDAAGNPTAPHAWFVGFADRGGQPKIAVAVLVENGGVNGNETTGGLAAAPIAKAVMEAYLNSPQGK